MDGGKRRWKEWTYRILILLLFNHDDFFRRDAFLLKAFPRSLLDVASLEGKEAGISHASVTSQSSLTRKGLTLTNQNMTWTRDTKRAKKGTRRLKEAKVGGWLTPRVGCSWMY